jgi:threonine dehydratase
MLSRAVAVDEPGVALSPETAFQWSNRIGEESGARGLGAMLAGSGEVEGQGQAVVREGNAAK